MNVALRFKEAIHETNSGTFMRISADSPMIDGNLLSKISLSWTSQYDFATNIYPRTFPKGQSVEILKSDFFCKNFLKFDNQNDFEHVTPYFYRQINNFKYYALTDNQDNSEFSLALDYESDFKKFASFVNSVGDSWTKLSYKEIMSFYLDSSFD